MFIPRYDDPSVLAYVQINVGYKLIKSITDMIAAGAPVSKTNSNQTNGHHRSVTSSSLLHGKTNDTNKESDNIASSNCVRRLNFGFSKNRLRLTGNESINRDIAITATINNPSVFTKYHLNWDSGELMVGVPMDAFRKAFGGTNDSTTSSTPQSSAVAGNRCDAIDIIVTSGSTTRNNDQEKSSYGIGDNINNSQHLWPRNIIFYNPRTNSGCETSCMLVSNVVEDCHKNAVNLLSMQPVDLVSLHAELGGVESCFEFHLENKRLTVSNNMGSATRKWRVFACDASVDPCLKFNMKIRSSIIHSIQKLKTITNEIVICKNYKSPQEHRLELMDTTNSDYINYDDEDDEGVSDDDDDDYSCYFNDGLVIKAELGPSTGLTRSKLKQSKKHVEPFECTSKQSSTISTDQSMTSSNCANVKYGELIVHMCDSRYV